MYIVHWKSIDTGKKYRCFDISAPAIFFHFGQWHRHENRIPKSQQLGNLLSLCREIAGARDILQKFENLKKQHE
jgi:hypothetical protein